MPFFKVAQALRDFDLRIVREIECAKCPDITDRESFAGSKLMGREPFIEFQGRYRAEGFFAKYASVGCSP
jgi:hypothetical protein